jgi:hypothetical protein
MGDVRQVFLTICAGTWLQNNLAQDNDRLYQRSCDAAAYGK